jgi:hypothetical protein
VAFKDGTESLLSFPHVINSKSKSVYKPKSFFGHHVGITDIQNTSDEKDSNNGKL